MFAIKNVLKAGLFAAALAIGTGVAHADTMTFSGTTTGKFTALNSSTDQTLTYGNGSFNGTTSNSGYVAFGGNGSNFGSFTLTDGTANFNNDPFALTITFTNPTGISGGQTSTFFATVFGSVTAGAGGGATVTFDPSATKYSFSNGSGQGNFTLNLNNVSVFSGQTASVTGYIQSNVTSNVTPEPNSLMLLGTGFVSAAGMLMRRRKMMAS